MEGSASVNKHLYRKVYTEVDHLCKHRNQNFEPLNQDNMDMQAKAQSHMTFNRPGISRAIKTNE